MGIYTSHILLKSELTYSSVAGRPAMKAHIFSGALVSLLAVTISPLCSARPPSHLHHRNDRLPRVIRAGPASAGSSLIGGGPDGLCGMLLSVPAWERPSLTWHRSQQYSGPCSRWNTSRRRSMLFCAPSKYISCDLGRPKHVPCS